MKLQYGYAMARNRHHARIERVREALGWDKSAAAYGCSTSLTASHEKAERDAILVGGVVIAVDTEIALAGPGRLYTVVKEGLPYRIKTHDDRGVYVGGSACDSGTYTGAGGVLFDSLEFCRAYYRAALNMGGKVVSIPWPFVTPTAPDAPEQSAKGLTMGGEDAK